MDSRDEVKEEAEVAEHEPRIFFVELVQRLALPAAGGGARQRAKAEGEGGGRRLHEHHKLTRSKEERSEKRGEVGSELIDGGRS